MNLHTLGIIDNILTTLLNDILLLILPLIADDEEKLITSFHIIWTFHMLTCSGSFSLFSSSFYYFN